ncbi:DNA polymerase iota isoform X2 [Ambystoma mexicanum]|uniref:DNA polymerase iota isoform X2 n=1 Tax=Ambystoma mexicanum TaxID=8296 RepID=UPI0037E94455
MELPATTIEEEDEEDEDWLLRSPTATRRPELSLAKSFTKKASATVNAAPRVIAHIDMDCFYAQVEMIRNPELKDKPLGVQQKYLVVTCNYTARNHGVKKCMSVKDAKEICPQLILVSGEDLTPYREMSYRVTAFNKNDPVHVGLAIGSQIAAEMRAALFDRFGLTGCAGVASNKLLCKLVGGTFKPNQQTVLLPESHQSFIDRLDHIKKVPGIGYKTTERLGLLGIRSLHDLRTFPLPMLEKELGASVAQRIQMLSCGEDDSLVTPTGPPQSLSDEDSFKKCSTEPEVKKKIEELLGNLLDRVYKDGRKPHTIRLTIRQFSPTNKWFNRESRQCPVPLHIIPKLTAGNYDVLNPLVDLLMNLFRKMINVKMPFHLTLLNVCFSNLKSISTSTKGTIGFYLSQSASASTPSKKVFQETEPADIEGLLQNDSNSFSFLSERSVHSKPEECLVNMTSAGEAMDLQMFPHQSLPEGVDQEVFSQLPEDIQKEILCSTVTRGASTSSVSSRPTSKTRDMQAFFSPKKTGTPTFSNNNNCDVSSASFGKHSQNKLANTTLVSVLDKPLAVFASSTQNSHASHECEVDGKYIEEETRKLPIFSSLCKDPIHLPSGSQTNIFQQRQDSSGSVTFMGTTCGGEDLVSPGEVDITFPSGVDPTVFSELPSVVQQELMTEWTQKSTVSKMHMTKHHQTIKEPKGKRTTALKSPQPNSLLKYFKRN